MAIGNRAYPDNDPAFVEPTGNARRIAQSLRQIGFDTQVGEDLTKSQMQVALDQFTAKIHSGTIGFIFFSGIGLQSGGHTYILPTDAVIWSEQDVRTNGFNLDRILATVTAKGAKVRIVVIDAARRNPFERRFRTSGSMGLAPIKGTNETLALYSNVPGAVFEEAGAATSPFVDELAGDIEAPGATAEEAFKRTRSGVSRSTLSGQRPWISSSLSEDFALDGRDCRKGLAARDPEPNAAVAPSTPAVAPPPATAKDVAGAEAPRKTPTAHAPITPQPVVAPPRSRDSLLTDTVLLEEVRDRLFEQNLDPGTVGSAAMEVAIRKFERQAKIPEIGVATDAVLQSLREADTLKPWGAIVFATSAKRWGMSWGRSLRRQALDEAKSRCGSDRCDQELSFWGRRCGAFALSSRSWTITWRNGSDIARKAAMGDCAKGGEACRLIGAVCADGSDRTN